jgi:hypothetical protein
MEHGGAEVTEPTEQEKDWNVVPHLGEISKAVIGAAVDFNVRVLVGGIRRVGCTL